MYEHRKSKQENEKTQYDEQAKKLKVKDPSKTSKRKKHVEKTEEKQSMFILSLDPYEKPLKWWETEHVKYAISYKPVKLRVEGLMGSHIIHLTDRQYMTTFVENIRNNYRHKQLSRIEKRKEWVETMFGSFILEDNI
ncbi:uncharacterized protein LOC124426369 [Vespa crabro]|uniref:uncharacterized protein LOC124426369 n=1 Tax=Vespa crabro TaxID=7445 RepID=UPI001EFFB59D|nr:uncharacterized protein LOC124426369 [Vespa crabro]XP_046823955.1 uncharacterized protein LOC124426369 [Vespa crabro]